MLQIESPRVQRLAFDSTERRLRPSSLLRRHAQKRVRTAAVEGIPENGTPNVRHVNANLVRASGDQC